MIMLRDRHEITMDPLHEEFCGLLSELIQLRNHILECSDIRLKDYRKCFHDRTFSLSAINLANYLALRQLDLRGLQDRLAEVGLSSLGRAEAAVLPCIDALIEILQRATNQTLLLIDRRTEHNIEFSKQTLAKNTESLFGKLPATHKAHIMVTLDAQSAWDYALVRSYLLKGMTCARINCAHDSSDVWEAMIANIRRAEAETGLTCRIMMDLAGHKIRTGVIEPAQPVYHIKVKKDRTGKVVASGYLVLTVDPENSSIETDLFKVAITKEMHKKLAPGALLEFTDNQGKQRYLKIEKALSSKDWLVSCEKSAYLKSGSKVRLNQPNSFEPERKNNLFPLGKFDGAPLDIRLYKDDCLLLTEQKIPGKPAEYSDSGVFIRPAHIGCTLASVFKKLEVGQSVWIDDGKLGAVIEQITEQGALLKVIHAKPGGVRIQSDRGLNFPETNLNLPALSAKDLKDLDFVCSHADLVGFSFVESLDDMNRLRAELKKRKAKNLPIIAKIETNRAVNNMPEILLGTMGLHPLGIMIARGDLAVELGNSRLAEIQEELLWICEAAHVPVIWATQVLESIAKKGMRSRPEFTDAAMAVRAECVMLNKGSFILDAIVALLSVMKRMDDHQHKKFSRLRKLHW